ncbi:MAG: anaerobic ribonucleoside-triphosphate reductase-activating protein [Bellilinea sp.]|nr:MAG: anaerobic ribonucleoside-triphosphate reductase-activating protein [Bellilinea sp.]
MASSSPLRIFTWLPAVREALGPGLRAVVWVQGCSLHCPGCLVPETWVTTGGEWVDAVELARDILQRSDVEGVTVSGGEPMEQAAGVASLLAAIKMAGKNTWVYTGYTLEELVARQDPATDEVLALTDVLVDGRYKMEQGGSFRWRGSLNQRIIRLTEAIPLERIAGGESSRIEIRLDQQGHLLIVGVPPPGFLRRFRQGLTAQGVIVSAEPPWI